MDSNQLYIYGRHPVEEALERQPDFINKIYLAERSNNRSFQKIISLASQNHIPVQYVPGRKLLEMVGKVNDQGCVALMSEIRYEDLDHWLELHSERSDNPFLLILDEIEDPQNFGAILRTAAAAGSEGIIVSKHRQAPISPAVFKTSAGTAGRIPIIRVVNLNQTILRLKEEGFWILGLDQHAGTSLWEQDFSMPVAVVIGNEGKGIRKKTLEHCDFTVSIPMVNEVESLNASVSAALICYEILRKRIQSTRS